MQYRKTLKTDRIQYGILTLVPGKVLRPDDLMTINRIVLEKWRLEFFHFFKFYTVYL